MSLAAPEYACPECGKFFQDERCVTLHLNNPHSACHLWMQEQVAMLGDQMLAHMAVDYDFPSDDDPYTVSFISITRFFLQVSHFC